MKNSVTNAEKEICTFFATAEHGLHLQDTFEMENQHASLMGVTVPYLFFAGKTTEDADAENPPPMLRLKVMRDFVGLDKVESDVRAAMVDFSFYITLGNMDEAYRSVKLIQNSSVWENMANMCVKTKRLDVAEVCLGHMGHARGAAAVQRAKVEPQKEAAVAMVAVQLGLLDDAARLYRDCGRYDLLNQLYRSAGYWSKALEVSRRKDRIHLKNTHYIYGQHLEALGDLKKAIIQYEKADMAHIEVPRMLHGKSRRNMEALEDYVEKSSDVRLLSWWGTYKESKEEYEDALHYFKRANDILSQVRVLCSMHKTDLAADLVNTHDSKVGAFHLARHMEASSEIPDAIHYYALAACFHHAIRLAKENGLDADLMNFALQSSKADMVETALYFERRQAFDQAVTLYQKGGDLIRALDLCFTAELYDVLHSISDELGDEATPEVRQKCVNFFLEHQHYAKAVHLLLKGDALGEALDLCTSHEVFITEEMAEKLTLPKSNNEEENKKRTRILLQVAKCCKVQGSFHLATKKYTQAGDKRKAMKCLLKSGVTHKIIFFAGKSSNKEIYIMGANYLQSLEWHENEEWLKSIILFYSKAKAFDKLSSFYETVAEMEIHEHQQYEKALVALKKATKSMSKCDHENKQEVLSSLQGRINIIEHFLEARDCATSDASKMVETIRTLIETPGVEDAIRAGDAYALLVTHYYQEGNTPQVVEVVKQMQSCGIDIESYIDMDIVKELNIDFHSLRKNESERRQEAKEGSDDDDIGEDIDEEMEHSGREYKE